MGIRTISARAIARRVASRSAATGREAGWNFSDVTVLEAIPDRDPPS